MMTSLEMSQCWGHTFQPPESWPNKISYLYREPILEYSAMSTKDGQRHLPNTILPFLGSRVWDSLKDSCPVLLTGQLLVRVANRQPPSSSVMPAELLKG